MFKSENHPDIQDCACGHGTNRGRRYNCAEPCYRGFYFDDFMCECYPKADPCSVTITVKSWITYADGKGSAIADTFIPSVPDVRPGQPIRVIKDMVQKSTGRGWNEWVDLFEMPYRVGEDYLGEEISYVVHKAFASSECD